MKNFWWIVGGMYMSLLGFLAIIIACLHVEASTPFWFYYGWGVLFIFVGACSILIGGVKEYFS